MNRTLFSLVIGAGLLGRVAVGHAQEVTSAVEGPGFEVSENTVFHPVLGIDIGGTNNVFYRSSNFNGSGLLRLIAEGSLASKKVEAPGPAEAWVGGDDEQVAEPAPRAIEFRAGGALAYTEYLSGDSVIRSQRNLGADLGANLVVFPQGTAAFKLDERFIRYTAPTNFLSDEDTDRITNAIGLGLYYQPGGRTMRGSIRFENQIDVFEEDAQRFDNRMINAILASYEWEFFPYSKVYADFSYSFITGLGDSGAIPTLKQDAQPIRGGAGIATSITELFTVKAYFGWAHASYENGPSYNTPVLGAEVGYRYSPLGRAVVAYAWDHRDSLNAQFYSDHGFTLRVDQQIDRFIASAGAEVHLRTYHGIPMEIGPPTRSDVIVAGLIRANYVFKDWIAAVATFRAETDQTDYRSDFGGDLDNPSYSRFELTGGVRTAF